MMKFTGERFIPNSSASMEMAIEHLQRYKSIREIVKNKIVVDAASGEGYGSYILAGLAEKVYGIDISKEAIEHAQSTYVKENLIFMNSSIEKLDISDNSVDIVVSFETIEHVDRDVQNAFIKEIKRILKKNGMLIISTPDKYLYSDLPNYKNEFHVKEFYREEFYEFLNSHFEHVEFYDQGFQVASVLYKNNKCGYKDFQSIPLQQYQLHRGKYIIALCSDKQIPEEYNINSIVLDYENKYEKFVDRIVDVQNEIEEKNRHINLQNDMISQRDLLIQKQNAKIEELSIWGKGLEEKNKKKSSDLQAELEKYEAVTKKIKDLNNHIEQLLIKERELNNIYVSDGWKLMKNYYRIRDKVLPKNSKRRLFLKLFFDIIKNPNQFIHSFNKDNIKKFNRYLKSGNIDVLESKIEMGLEKYHKDKFNIKIYNKSQSYEKLIFPKADNPLVSIIIPVFNQWEFTYGCLKSILENTKGVDYEVIIADDLSTDETVNIRKYVENIRVIRNKQNMGFLLNCNNAAKYAKSKYISFLNNDTNVQENWLKYLVELLENNPDIGMAGSKLIYADGHLQEAGGIIWRDASGWNYGHMDDPEKPEYNYVKEVDYISGASIVIRRDLWNDIGGFDEQFKPAYFEDVDIAFSVRKCGYKVIYQPKSIVVHFEGISHGTDIKDGIKRYQEINRRKFVNKWHDILNKEHFNNGENIFWERDRSKSKKTILVIDHYVPQYDKDAGSRATFYTLKIFLDLNMNVKFIGDNFYQHEPYTTVLEQMGIEVLYGVWYRDNYKKWIKENGDKIDYIYLNRPHISIKYIDFVKENTKAKIMYMGHDLHYLREFKRYKLEKDKSILELSEYWKKIEYKLFKSSDSVFTFSEDEKRIISEAFPNKRVNVVPLLYFDVFKESINEFSNRRNIMFVGGFSHTPNIDAVKWFVNEIFPKVLEKISDIKFYIVGSNPPEEIQRLNSSNIIVKGYVPDEELDNLYSKVKLVVIPLRYGAGVKGKTLEAMYNQVPIVTTDYGIEGLKGIRDFITPYNNANDFAEQIIKLYFNDKYLKEISDSYLQYLKQNFSKDTALDIFKRALDLK